ncbi:MAG: transposase [Elusimicrobia bacterium]|nr:transposase [Elusimicrobiota bacterium]
MEDYPTAVSWARALNELGGILRLDSNEAALMLEEACRREPPRCRRCGCDRIYRLNAGRLRCSDCRYSFRMFTGRWLGRHRLPAKVWLAAVKCFELGLGARELAQVADLSLPTAAELERTVQMSLAALDPSWTTVVRACASGGDVPHVFRIRQQGDGVRVEALPETDGDVRVDIAPAGSSDDALRTFRAGLRRWLRLPPDRLALKLKEWELRQNRTGPLFELALQALVRYMPSGVSDA